ncbi:MAG: acyl-CoA thioesterase, partial [Bacteroidales bacterium]|nr:acyl-CoA thioesterase [Bacteroidales bacterium]
MSEFTFPYRVSISDINYGGHMGNDRSLSLFHESRIAFLKSLGYSEMDIGEGLGIIMKDAHVDFLAEVFHGEQLSVTVKLGEQKGLLFYLEYEVFREHDQKIVLKGSTGILAFDYQKR